MGQNGAANPGGSGATRVAVPQSRDHEGHISCQEYDTETLNVAMWGRDTQTPSFYPSLHQVTCLDDGSGSALEPP